MIDIGCAPDDVMRQHADKFNVLPMFDVEASDEALFANLDWIQSNEQAAPLAALIPLLVMIYGIGITSKVFVVCIMAMPVIVLNTAGAARNAPSSLTEMGRSFLATHRELLVKIVIPAASPVIFSIIVLAVLFLNFLEKIEHYFFEGNIRGYASD